MRTPRSSLGKGRAAPVLLVPLVVALACMPGLARAQGPGAPSPFSVKSAEDFVGWPKGPGSGQLQGNDHFHIVNSGPCAINEARLHKYASSLAGSPNLMAVGGDHGKAVAECISAACDSMPRITYEWDLPMEEDPWLEAGGPTAGRPSGRNSSNLTSAIDRSWPRCERGTWKPIVPSTVHVSVFQNSVAFAAAGCLEIQGVNLEDQEWTYVASLPKSLELKPPPGAKRKGGVMKPELFGTRVALGNGVAAATAAVDAPGSPPVVVVFSLLGASWEQVDVLECGGGAACACGEGRQGCFGAAVAVQGSRVAVGFPNNGSVVLYQQLGGAPLTWEPVITLTNRFDTLTSAMFGASLSLGDDLLVVGAPSAGAGARAVIYSVSRGSPGFGGVLYETADHCCKLGLPCCISGLVGSAVALAEYSEEAAAIVGDPRSAQVHIIRCNTTAVREGAPPEGSACEPQLTVQGPPSGANPMSVGPDGFGGSLAYGGQMVLMGHAARHCSVVGPMQACGTVC